MLLIFILPRVLFIFKFCTFPAFLKCSRFFGGVPGFLGVFLVFFGCSGFSWGCSWFLQGVPGFLGVFLVFWVFRDVPGCSGVPVFRVPVFQCSGVPGSTTCHFVRQLVIPGVRVMVEF